MKKTLPYIIILMLSVQISWAQEIKEKIEAAKVGLITQQLNLTSEQSKQFWPIYNKYTDEIQAIRKQLRDIKRGFQTKSDDQLKKDLDKLLELREKEIVIEKKYLQEFLKVINVRQVAMLHKADQMFKAMLLKRLSKQKIKREGKEEDEILEDIDD